MIEMSVIAAKKAEQKKGPEAIFLYMGLTFGVVIVFEFEGAVDGFSVFC